MFLPYDPRTVQELADELDAWQTRLDNRGPLPRAWAGRLRRDLEAEAIAASTSMEGVPVTVEEVRRILAGDLPPETKAEDVPQLLDGACSRMEEGHAHPAIGSAWIHVAAAAIHPFGDGNGRASRVVASLAMYREGFKLPEFTSLEEWWGRHLSDYYSAFRCLGESFDPNADVTAFIQAHMQAQVSQVRALDLRERVQQRIWIAVEEAVATAGLDPRVANAVWDAFFGREVTPRYYRPLADVSPATATTDLAAAVAEIGRASCRER